MSETDIIAAPSSAVEPAVAAILKLFGDRVESVTVAAVNGSLRQETTVSLAARKKG